MIAWQETKEEKRISNKMGGKLMHALQRSGSKKLVGYWKQAINNHRKEREQNSK